MIGEAPDAPHGAVRYAAGDVASLRTELEALQGEITTALEDINLPAYLLDATGRIRWLNRSARDLLGDVIGKPATDVVGPNHVDAARTMIVKTLLGTVSATDTELEARTKSGDIVALEVTSASVRDDSKVVAVFGLARPRFRVLREAGRHRLTRRQREVLSLLAAGCGTNEMAAELHLSPQTIRNHVRDLLHSLGVHSRLEAVVEAHARGLLEEAPNESGPGAADLRT